MESRNGWIMPGGEYIDCAYGQHEECAWERLHKSEETLSKTAIKVHMSEDTQLDFLLFMKTGKRQQPLFLTTRREYTNEQLNTVEKYCLHFGLHPPTEYFYQKDLLDLSSMPTEDVLVILREKA
ncbi:MAG: hypothetical protein UT42_C0055G0002 [Candidatus Falkowbacteria bacterium GW2011_GWA2_39_24]|uniref:Uncharacterized protein n=1 Tax=Candidatus Falkowbacteria bacterium GW2011_GWA2_39_24 TaxID=1618634 RepID=A0A0G0NAD6_9BACT|nr:MAG: hypothetical protein UT42_C0055G0002 [Candidatus Falkowbacteria bacterium GW2011_GWA2_39_24]